MSVSSADVGQFQVAETPPAVDHETGKKTGEQQPSDALNTDQVTQTITVKTESVEEQQSSGAAGIGRPRTPSPECETRRKFKPKLKAEAKLKFSPEQAPTGTPCPRSEEVIFLCCILPKNRP